MNIGRVLASGFGALVVTETAAAVVVVVRLGWTWQQALDAFVVTNSAMALTFGICGAILAWHRPRNPIGWLFLADGLGHATTALCAPLDGPLIATIASYAWPWSIGLFLPLSLVLFPDGRLPSRRWRAVAIAIVVTAPLFVIELGADPEGPGYLKLPGYAELGPLWIVSELRTLAALLAGVVALAVRYRRGEDSVLWLLLAASVAAAFVVPWSFVAGTPVFVLLSIPLIPVAVTIAIVRHQLLDIRLVVSRVLAWVLLSAVVLVVYGLLVAVLDRFVSAQLGRSVVATVVVALLVAPVLPRLQRLVDRALYGDRGDPARVVSKVGEHLAGEGLAGVVEAVRVALRVPYVALTAGQELAGNGTRPDNVEVVPLEYDGVTVGELHVGVRTGESTLGAADRNVLRLVAAPLAVAVHATLLSTQLQASRERLVTAREEERRRLRRDLHDGLGPTLTGVALSADAATNLLATDPDRTRTLITGVSADVRTAIADVRRLVEDLRPPALDELGLLGALRQRAEHLVRTPLQLRLDVPDEVPRLSAAVEVAAYRIATEALTNVVRHSRASSVILRLSCAEALEVEVTDDGPPNGPWHPGVGMQAMRERAAELGGGVEAGPTERGGRVWARLPVVEVP
ncbi:histidine kinase [Lentzea aerocolonigenes]|uniref:histidine kinase n=1 Tax=Lentzea aerocolonigenes TaxID=68170 RepID=A0A0F0GNE5_LENAE|nr:histidine kinase [Lentzea aerocolonigenes]KJK44116.1 histidine kinase [Lentzea aerocolonigenes]